MEHGYIRVYNHKYVVVCLISHSVPHVLSRRIEALESLEALDNVVLLETFYWQISFLQVLLPLAR